MSKMKITSFDVGDILHMKFNLLLKKLNDASCDPDCEVVSMCGDDATLATYTDSGVKLKFTLPVEDVLKNIDYGD